MRTDLFRKNHVDEMAGRDSGGEGQNPKYVASAGWICHALYAAEQPGVQSASGITGRGILQDG